MAVGRARALMSAENYQDKKALPLVEKLKEVVKNLTIRFVQLTDVKQFNKSKILCQYYITYDKFTNFVSGSSFKYFSTPYFW